jgi:hypothetical protein
MIHLLCDCGRFHVPDSKQRGQVGPLLGRIPTEALIKREELQGALEFRYFITLDKKSDKNFIPIMLSRKTRGRSLDNFRFAYIWYMELINILNGLRSNDCCFVQVSFFYHGPAALVGEDLHIIEGSR